MYEGFSNETPRELLLLLLWLLLLLFVVKLESEDRNRIDWMVGR